MTRSFISSLALAAVLPVGLGAQDAGDAADRIAEALARVEAAGVPIELLQDKRAEGLAKGVAVERLADVMQQRADALITAREAMPESDANALVAGADAVEAGIGPDALSHIETTVPSERRFVAVYALSLLVGLGHAPHEAMQTVDDALARGPEALSNVATEAQEALARRGPPEGFGATSLPGMAGPPGSLTPPCGAPTGPPGGPPGGRS